LNREKLFKKILAMIESKTQTFFGSLIS